MSFCRARLQFIVLMLITSHWFACIWGMCADLQGEDYESFTWLDALYYATKAQVGRGRVGIFVNLPHSAHLVEVTSTTVQDAHHGLFEELLPSMCQTAMRLTQPSADLTTLWSELGDVDEDAGGLPSLLAVSVMVPTSSPKDVERFLRKYGRNEVSHCNAKSSWPCGSFLAAVFFQNTGEPLPKFLRIIGARALRSKPLPSPSPSRASAPAACTPSGHP